jgi:epoxyqueuosine reductase
VDRGSDLAKALGSEGLVALGAAPSDPDHCPAGTRTLVLIGTEGGRAWWDRVTDSPEWQDGTPDPVDRWSKRVLGGIAARFGGIALFPSDGPPWPPFQRWALATGRVWESPVRLLVHAEAGLWVAFRGALALPFEVALPAAARPCDRCLTKPCLTACPVGALTEAGYEVPRCRTFLDTPAGADCMGRGCAARRACPVSQSHARLTAQSAYHMSRFHP